MGNTDWQIKKTLVESVRYMLENEVSCDVTFKVGEHKEPIKAHKFVLSARSPVFDRMLNGFFKERKEDPAIEDVDPDTFRAILRHCYYDCVEVGKEIAFTTLCAAKQFMLPLLEEAARKAVCKNANNSNIVQLYTYSTSTNDAALKKYCHSYLKEKLCNSIIWEVYSQTFNQNDDDALQICRQYFQQGVSTVRKALNAESFLEIKHEVLLDFLHINDVYEETQKVYSDMAKGIGPDFIDYKSSIGISLSEIELFKACSSWAVAECLRQKLDPNGPNKRDVLGECLFLIRFPAMLLQDLGSIVYPADILTAEEKDNIFQYHFRDAETELAVPFPTKSRCFMQTVSPLVDKFSIKPTERVLFTRLWSLHEGMYTVTVVDEAAGKTQIVKSQTKHEQHLYWESYKEKYQLLEIDIEPIVLEVDRMYTVSIIGVDANLRLSSPGTKCPIVQSPTPFQVLQIAQEDSGDYDCAVTLCLV